MCIICNLSDHEGGLHVASALLSRFSEAQTAMAKATEAMRQCALLDPRYDASHKQMVRLMRAWNEIEHTRERDCKMD